MTDPHALSPAAPDAHMPPALRTLADASAPERQAELSLDQSWIYKVTVLADRISRHTSSVAAQVAGLNLSQWRVLAALADQDGRTASQVVNLTPMDKGIVSRAVASLVRAELVRRIASDRDGRLSHLHLTDEGRHTYRAIADRLDETGGSGRTLLGQDPEAFLREVDRLITHYPSSQAAP